MPIDMPRGLPFSVDTWNPNSKRKRHHFLTHAHKDHLTGFATHASYPVYATRLTKSLVLPHFPQVGGSLFVEIEVGESVVVHDPDGAFTVTAFDANHCPGAVMFLFEGEFGNVLHTGDCRLISDCVQNLPLKYITKKGKETLIQLDYLFLDCTFVRCSIPMPSKQSAIQQVIKCIWKHPNAPKVYLACDLLGQEEILVEVSKTFGSKIYVDKSANADCFQALLLIAPEILTEDVSTCFQVFGFTKLYERASIKLAEARASIQDEPLFIRPSAQWYASDEASGTQGAVKSNFSESVRDEYGIWHTCYSMHSSREELESALQLLQPKWVISTTPPCRAMELDYVKKHCFETKMNADNPLWKLLKIDTVSKRAVKVDTSSTAIQIATNTVENRNLQLKEASINCLETQLHSSDSSPTEQPITLFGRARLGIENKSWSNKVPSFAMAKMEEVAFRCKNKSWSHKVSSFAETKAEEVVFPCKDATMSRVLSSKIISVIEVKEVASERKDVISSPVPFSETTTFSQDDSMEFRFDNSADEKVKAKDETWCIGSSKDLNPSLKRLYRSLNVPVPRPLPSLAELAARRVRIKCGRGV